MAAPIRLTRIFSLQNLRRKILLSSSYTLNSKCSLHSTNRKYESSPKNETHFGYQRVSEEEKERKVHDVFENVASKYDLMNDAMSVGVHRLWKDYFMETFSPVPGTKLIDVGGGTGDIAFRFLKFIEHKKQQLSKVIPHEEESKSDLESHVTVFDINQPMLDVGKERAIQRNLNTNISWVQGNAEDLQMNDNSFDAYTIAYCIRNCTHIDKVLSEAHRVLKPGGRFMCLEFSRVENSFIRSAYDFYSFQMIPVMGQVLAGDYRSYQYLVESIRQFPDQEEFKWMIQDAGFKCVTFENLTFGVSAIHSGFKL